MASLPSESSFHKSLELPAHCAPAVPAPAPAITPGPALTNPNPNQPTASVVSFIQEKLAAVPHSDLVSHHLQSLLNNELVLASYQKLMASSATAHLEHARTTYLDPFIDHARTTYLDPFVVQPLANLLTNMPDLLSVFVLLAALFVSLRILDYGRRLVMFWVTLALRLVYWGFIICAGVYVYNVGLEKAAQDLGWFYGLAKGVVESFQNGADGQRRSSDGWGGYSYTNGQVRG